jgi:hypothetical protein
VYVLKLQGHRGALAIDGDLGKREWIRPDSLKLACIMPSSAIVDFELLCLFALWHMGPLA